MQNSSASRFPLPSPALRLRSGRIASDLSRAIALLGATLAIVAPSGFLSP